MKECYSAMDMKKKDDVLPLLSRAQFDEDLRALADEASPHPWALLFVDFDLFKDINDSCGHEAGDEVLMKAAQVLASISCGKGDAYRRGGDEIAVILPNHTVKEATVIAEDIRASIEKTSFERCTEKMTVSIGIACYPETIEDHGRLFSLADTMMYRAKDYGGNCICIPRVSGHSAETILPEGRRYMRGDITSRVEAVELWMSLNAVNGRQYDILIKNDNDEEVAIEGVTLRFGNLYLCSFSKPKESTIIKARSSARISGEFESDPVSTLQFKLPSIPERQCSEFEIVARGRVLGRLRTFSHTILATISSAGHMDQFSPR